MGKLKQKNFVMKNLNKFLILIILSACSMIKDRPADLNSEVEIHKSKNSYPFNLEEEKLTSSVGSFEVKWVDKGAMSKESFETYAKKTSSKYEDMMKPQHDPYYGELTISKLCLKPNRPDSSFVQDSNYQIHSTSSKKLVDGMCSTKIDKYKVQVNILHCRTATYEIKVYYPIANDWIKDKLVSCSDN